jgi:tetratricopeptide (TPR) repeat protein
LIKGIIEQVTGKRVGEVLDERIWQPLGMSNTTMFIGGDVLDHRASAYRLGVDGVSYQRVLGEPSAYAGGGIYTTAGDLLTFDQALYGEHLLDARHKEIMFTPVEASPNYAYGWIVYELGDVTVISHSGGSGGFNTEFRRYPENGYTLIVMSNYEGGAWALADKIERLLLGLPYELATEADANFNRGMHLQSHNAFTEAMAVFEKNCTGDTPHMPSLYQAARTRILAQTDQKAAVALLDQYISLADETSQPSIAAAWWRKGVAYEQLGDVEQAITCHQTCLELDKGFEDAAEALQRLQEGN